MAGSAGCWVRHREHAGGDVVVGAHDGRRPPLPAEQQAARLEAALEGEAGQADAALVDGEPGGRVRLTEARPAFGPRARAATVTQRGARSVRSGLMAENGCRA